MTTRDMPRLHDRLKQGVGERGTHAGREAPSSGRGTDGPKDDREDRRPRRTGGRRGSFRLALSSLALLALIAAIGAIALKHLAMEEALSDARSVTVAVSRGVLRTAVTPAVLRGDRAAVDRLDRTVHEAVLGHPIVRVKVWAPSGTIVYSDARALIGRRFPLPVDLRESLDDGSVRAEISDLSRPENRLERGRGRLVEVYLPVRLASGRLVMVEAYHPAGTIDAASHRIWRTFLPMLLALLAALAAVQLPLVRTQSRRARANAREREQLAAQRERLASDAEDALQKERGRLATELHDGIVQDLAGAGYALHAAASMPADAPHADLREALSHGAEVCRTSMTKMRALLADLRTPHHVVQDIQGALEALAQPLRATGVEVIVLAGVDGAIDGESALVIHRAAREILLDIRRRADATLVTIALVERDGDVVLTVDRNAVPVDGAADRAVRAGAGGLDSLKARLVGLGGSLVVERETGGSARYIATVPDALNVPVR